MIWDLNSIVIGVIVGFFVCFIIDWLHYNKVKKELK